MSGLKADPSVEVARPGQISRRVASRGPSSLGRDSGRGTVLTIRVRKSDLDALAKGDLKPEDFAKQAIFHAYEGSGHDLAGLNAWTQKAYPVRN